MVSPLFRSLPVRCPCFTKIWTSFSVSFTFFSSVDEPPPPPSPPPPQAKPEAETIRTINTMTARAENPFFTRDFITDHSPLLCFFIS
jgi:hypothetical protein